MYASSVATARSPLPAAGRAPAAGVCAAALGLGATTLLAFKDGGYFSATWSWSTLAFAAAAGIALLVRRGPRLESRGWLALCAVAALALWMLASARWGVPGTEATREASRAGLYVAALGAFLVIVDRRSTRAFLIGVLGGIVAIESYALAERVVAPRPPDPFQGTLLVGPLGYANALGVLSAVGTLLALGLLRAERRPLSRTALGGAAAVSVVALALTSSRGATASLLVGLAVLGALSRARRTRRLLLAVAVIAVPLAAAASIALEPRFLGDRPAYWHVALTDSARHPVLGSGAGSFDDVWLAERPIPASVRDAHSLYLEVLAELGPVGLLLLLAALAAPLVATRSASRVDVVPAAAAGYCAFLAHAGIDWDWEMPAITLAGLACGAALLASARSAPSL